MIDFKTIYQAVGILVFFMQLTTVHGQNGQTISIDSGSKTVILQRPDSIIDLFSYKEFEDKVLYIDVWGSRCKPCIKEFKFKDSLKKAFKDKDVVFLYLATTYFVETEGPRFEEDVSRWKEFIQKYNLEGYHLYLDYPLFEDMWTFLEGSSKSGKTGKKYSIPRYFIIDRNGKLVEDKAYRPSSKDAVIAQIKKYL